MFDDRSHAGRALARLAASRVPQWSATPPLAVLALPRGGVPVGIELARRLEATLEFDVFLVRKLGVPDREELAFGAIATGGVRVLNREVIEEVGLSSDQIERIAQREQIELERREYAYRENRAPISLRDRVALLVDDGLATGASMIAAVRAVRRQEPKRVVVAVPIASQSACVELRAVADEVIAAKIPEPFYAVGYWYRNFDQVTDEQVRELLRPFRSYASTPHSALQTSDSAGSG
jgi:putative phosphoribosyl transferase